MSWLSGWNYRKSITISRASGAVTNYQMKLLVGESSGSGTNDVHCEGHALPSFNDLRFTASDGTTVLDYWIESISGTTPNQVATVWIEFDSIGTGATTFEMYYGNSIANPYSEGYNTFPQFDDFRYPAATIGGIGAAWGSIVLVGSTYHMFFVKNDGTTLRVINRATSNDLVNWTDQGAVTFSGDSLTYREAPALLKSLDGVTPLQYNGYYWMLARDQAATPAPFKLYYASTIDGTWTYSKDVLAVGTSGDWDDTDILSPCFFMDGTTYYIFYEGQKASDSKWRIGYASCATPDGTWSKAGSVLAPSLAWESTGVVDPIVRLSGGTYYLFYSGNPTAASSYNSWATCATLTGTWVKSSDSTSLGVIGSTYAEIVLKDKLYYMNYDYHVGSDNKKVRVSLALTGPYTNVNQWTVTSTPTFLGGSPGELKINNHAQNLKSPSTFQYKALRAMVKFATPAKAYQYFGFQASNGAGVLNEEMFFTYNTPDLKAFSGNASASEGLSIYDAGYFGSYHIYEIWWKSGEAKFYIDGSLKATQTTDVCDSTQPVGIFEMTTDADLYMDWVFVRSYSPTEPAWGNWGGEEPLNFILSIAGLAHADSLEAFAITQVHTLAVDALSHANAIDNIALTQVHNLAVAGLAHANAIGNVVLSQIHQLAIDAISHAHSIDGPALTQIHQLIVDALSHAHSLDGLNLFQLHNLVVQELIHSHSIDNIDLIYVAATLLVIQDLVHSHSLGEISLSQVHQLVVQALSHVNVIDGLTLAQVRQLSVQALQHTHLVSGNLFLIQAKKQNFTYQNLKLLLPPVIEGGFGYQKLALKAPAGPEGDFVYQHYILEKEMN